MSLMKTDISSQEVRLVRHRLVGMPSQVKAVLDNAQKHGALVRVFEPTVLHDHRVKVDVVVLEPVQTAVKTSRPRVAVTGSTGTPWYRQFRVWLRATAALLALVVLGTFVYVLYLVVAWVIAHIALLIGIVLLVLLAGGLLTAKSAGVHCPGCKG
jgi:hypothetical protein